MADDFDKLLTEGVNTATSFLKKNGEFFPFAIAITSAGEIRHVQAWHREEHPRTEEVMQMLHAGLREEVRNGSYCAIAVVTDVKLTDRVMNSQTDAIRVDMETESRSPVTCYVPYALQDGAVMTEDVIAVPGSHLIFHREGN